MDYDEQVQDIVANAQFGDLIEFSYPIGYSHWGVYDDDGHVIHFGLAYEGQVKSRIRSYIQSVLPVCGDLLIGETVIRRQPVGEVTVPNGAHVMVTNNRHARHQSPVEEIRRRRDALLGKLFPYDLFSLNCEHFATFVRFGQSVCNQIPGKSKNEECKEATKVFQSIVTEYTEMFGE